MANNLEKKYFLPLAILGMAFLISYSLVAFAQTPTSTPSQGLPGQRGTATTQGITFPVPELGNCTDKDTCRAYCNEPTHMDECISFAKAHGLMNKDEADRSEKFRQKLVSGGGPGGCTNPRDCEAYCSVVANIETCIKFAKEQGISDPDVAQGERILTYTKSGGRMPGDCTSKESCDTYCSNFSHAQECINFSRAAGIVRDRSQGNGQGIANGGEPTSDQLQKLSDLAKNGQTPGGCTSKDACETYCQDQTHRDECIAFGVKIGFIKQDEADMIKKSGGFGPGGCNSSDACRAYCNDQTHRDECFKFAEDHGYVSHDEATQTKQGFVRLRTGLDQAPPEVTECLKSTVGPNIIDDIQSGKFVPGPDIGQSVKSCFEKFGSHGDPTEPFKKAPPEVLACLKEKLGDDFAKIKSGESTPTPEMADTFRVCFQKVQFQSGFQGGAGGPVSGGQRGPGLPGQGVFGGQPPAEAVKHFIKTAPPEILPCIKEQLGDAFDRVRAGEEIQVDTSKLKTCFEKFRPAQPGSQSFVPGGQGQGFGGGFGGGQIHNASPELQACLKENLGDDFSKLQSNEEKPTPEMMQAMKGCFQKFRPGVQNGIQSGLQNGIQSGLQSGLRSGIQNLPPPVLSCLKEKLGDDFAKLQSGDLKPTPELELTTKGCFAGYPLNSGQSP